MPPTPRSWWTLITPRLGRPLHPNCHACRARGPITHLRLNRDGTSRLTFANGTTKDLPATRSVLR